MNRIFKFYEDRIEHFYCASSPADAAKCHSERIGRKVKPAKAEEVDPDRTLCIGFDDCTEALVFLTGGDATVIRAQLDGMPMVDEYIGIRQAAQQWARRIPAGAPRFLASL